MENKKFSILNPDIYANETKLTVIHLNGAVSINKWFYTGLELQKIYYSDYFVKDDFNFYSLFTQFDFFGKRRNKMRLFAETSINVSDIYVDLFIDAPSHQKYIWYHGLGGGLDIPLSFISENVYLDLAFYNYHMLNNIYTKSNYTQYIAGINIHIGKRVFDKKRY